VRVETENKSTFPEKWKNKWGQKDRPFCGHGNGGQRKVTNGCVTVRCPPFCVRNPAGKKSQLFPKMRFLFTCSCKFALTPGAELDKAFQVLGPNAKSVSIPNGMNVMSKHFKQEHFSK
jgi:hypothetical protein